jgi:hypothetical protein
MTNEHASCFRPSAGHHRRAVGPGAGGRRRALKRNRPTPRRPLLRFGVGRIADLREQLAAVEREERLREGRYGSRLIAASRSRTSGSRRYHARADVRQGGSSAASDRPGGRAAARCVSGLDAFEHEQPPARLAF